jgi:hypothetical protein
MINTAWSKTEGLDYFLVAYTLGLHIRRCFHALCIRHEFG